MFGEQTFAQLRTGFRAPRSEHVNTLSQKYHWLLIPGCIVYIYIYIYTHTPLSCFLCCQLWHSILPLWFFYIYNTVLDISMLKKVPSYWLSQNSTTKLKAVAHPPTWVIPSLQTSLERREATISWFSHLRIVSLRTETAFYNLGETCRCSAWGNLCIDSDACSFWSLESWKRRSETKGGLTLSMKENDSSGTWSWPASISVIIMLMMKLIQFTSVTLVIPQGAVPTDGLIETKQKLKWIVRSRWCPSSI